MMKYRGHHQATFFVIGFLFCCSPVASKDNCQLNFLEDNPIFDLTRVPVAAGGTLYLSSSTRVAASCRGRITEVHVLYKATGQTNEAGLLAETAIAVYTPVDSGLERSSEFVRLKPEAGVLNRSGNSVIVQVTFTNLTGDAALEVEPGQTIGVLISSNSPAQNGQRRVSYPLLIGETADTLAIHGQSSFQALGQPTFTSNQQGQPSALPAYYFQIESDAATVEDNAPFNLLQNVSVELVTTNPKDLNSSSMLNNSSSPDNGAAQNTLLVTILPPIAAVILVAILSAVTIATSICCAIWRKRRSSNWIHGSPNLKKREERARAHAADLSALESAVSMESHGGQEESTGYEVVIHHKEIRGVSSVFFERNSCYMYVDADEEVNTAEPYEVPINIYEDTVQQEASSRRHIWATGNDAHPRTALQTGGGKEDMYINVPFVPPPTNVQGLRKTLAKRRCVELPRGALKTACIVGAGEFGDVYSGTWKSSYGEQEVAIKVLKKKATEEHKVKFLQEAVIMSQFRHPHIVRLLGAVTFKEPKMLVLEYLHKGDLLRWLVAQNRKSEIDKQELPGYLLQFCKEIADGMKYLSNKGFIHRDLAARNILLDNTLTCKIADFGMSRNLSGSQFYSATGANIPVRWSPPEVLLEKKFTMSSDVWSYGMVMHEIWSLGSCPYPELSDLRDVVKVVVRGREHIQPPPAGCPRAAYDVMVKCWNYVYYKRPTFAEVLTLVSVISASDLLDVA